MTRTLLCQQRRALSPRLRRHLAQQSSLTLHKLATHIAPKLPKNAAVALYDDAFGELATYPIIHLCRLYGWQPYLPVVVGTRLNFVAVAPKFTLKNGQPRLDFAKKKHRLGMSEPLGIGMSAKHLDACFCPLVAIDKQGVRMGMGGGFYDRTLVNFCGIKIGYGYDFQVVDSLPKMPWDIAMDYMVTPKRLWVF